MLRDLVDGKACMVKGAVHRQGISLSNATTKTPGMLECFGFAPAQKRSLAGFEKAYLYGSSLAAEGPRLL